MEKEIGIQDQEQLRSFCMYGEKRNIMYMCILRIYVNYIWKRNGGLRSRDFFRQFVCMGRREIHL